MSDEQTTDDWARRTGAVGKAMKPVNLYNIYIICAIDAQGRKV